MFEFFKDFMDSHGVWEDLKESEQKIPFLAMWYTIPTRSSDMEFRQWQILGLDPKEDNELKKTVEDINDLIRGKKSKKSEKALLGKSLMFSKYKALMIDLIKEKYSGVFDGKKLDFI